MFLPISELMWKFLFFGTCGGALSFVFIINKIVLILEKYPLFFEGHTQQFYGGYSSLCTQELRPLVLGDLMNS